MTDPKKQGRSVEDQIEIDAPLEAVWKALTDAGELVNWFPREARVTPGENGRYWMSWGGQIANESRIEIWEPNRRLRTVAEQGFWAEGGKVPLPLALEFILEAKGGKTIVRVVHSGFGTGAAWDEEYDGVRSGWAFELRGLRHYLERQRGNRRRVVWVEFAAPGSKEELWQRLAQAAPGVERAAWREGDRYSLQAVTGDRLEGVVMNFDPPKGFSGTLDNLNGSVFRLLAEKMESRLTASVWLSLYGVPEAEAQRLEERWTAAMQKLFPNGERVIRPLRAAAV